AAPSLQDVHATSTGAALMPGDEIQANAIESALHGFPLRDSPAWFDVLAILVLGMAPPLANLRASPRRAAALVVGLGGGYTLATQLAFNAGRVLAFTYPIGALLIGAVGATGVHAVTSA